MILIIYLLYFLLSFDFIPLLLFDTNRFIVLFVYISFIFLFFIAVKFLKKYENLFFNYNKYKNNRELLFLKSVIFFIILFIFITILRIAWFGDDAYIAFRVVDNFVNGYGLRWNVEERVQTYTSPLWLFLNSFIYFFYRDIYVVALVNSFIFSFLSIWIVYKLSKSYNTAIVVLLILLFSKPFIEYCTSGLENPLLYFLFSIFLFFYFKNDFSQKNLIILTLISSLIIITRQDNILLIIPPIFYFVYKTGIKKSIFPIFIGSIPFIAWELFSLIYYGFPFPNTYYAKVFHKVPQIKILEKGVNYYFDIMIRSPETFLIIIICIIITILEYTKNKKNIFITAGIILYFIYILKIGGDFMTGRFFSTVLLISACIVSQYELEKNKIQWLVLMIFILCIGIFGKNFSPLYTTEDFFYLINENEKGIADERGYYYPVTSLVCKLKDKRKIKLYDADFWIADGIENREKSKNGRLVVKSGPMGLYGFYSGPKVYIIDDFALTDPFLSRLPSHPASRIGHFARELPEGYFESVKQNKNLLKDKNLAEFYDKILLITRGPIFSKERFKTIIKMNLGLYDYLLPKKF
ncbi:MAG: glycosyltransferase family 39 protein [Candidatus Goldbacteria bacterium]|nr:glycosyltransferase family 39 protein [Candidatus Goldiibacteriota bacterium]